MSVSQLKDGRWIVQYPNPDKDKKPRLVREYYGRGYAAKMRAEKRDRELGLRSTCPRRKHQESGPTFKEIAAEYCQKKQVAKVTRYALESRLRSSILPAIGTISAIRMTPDIMDAYVAKRTRAVSAASTRRDVVDIKTILNWGAKTRMIPHNPIRDYQPPQIDTQAVTPPTPTEIAAILHHAQPRLYRAIKIAFYTGLRPGPAELYRLRWSSVLWDRNVIRIQSAQKGGIALRDIPIHPDFLILLSQWWRQDGQTDTLIIHQIKDKCRPVNSLVSEWLRAKKKAGIHRRLRFYDFRHDFVTTALESGVDIKTLAEIVGSSPETLRKHYQHVSGFAKVQAIAAIRPTGNIGNTICNFEK